MVHVKSVEPIVVIGCSGFGREVLDIMRAAGRECTGVVDDSPSTEALDKLDHLGAPYLGSINDWLESKTEPSAYVVAIAWPKIRYRIVHRIDRHGHYPATLIHPTANIGHGSYVSPGSVICAGALVSTFVHLGPHTHINPGAVVGHDSSLRAFTTLNPRATVSGSCTIGELALLGANSTILQGLTVGPEAVIGAGSVITKNVPSSAIAKGIPGRWS